MKNRKNTMMGLLLKESISLRSQLKTYALFILLYGAIGYIIQDTSMLETMMYLLAIMIILSSFTYDNTYNWDHYAVAMPAGRDKIVYSKYVLSLAVTIPTAVMTALLNALLIRGGGGIDLIRMLTPASAILILHALLIPLIYKIGVEKARYALMAIFIIPVVLVFVFPDEIKALDFSQGWLALLSNLLPAITALLLAVSARISLAIFRKKEF